MGARPPSTAAKARELMLLMMITKLDTTSLKKCGQHVEKCSQVLALLVSGKRKDVQH